MSGPAGGRRGPSPPATHEFRMVNALSNRTGGLTFLFYFWINFFVLFLVCCVKRIHKSSNNRIWDCRSPAYNFN